MSSLYPVGAVVIVNRYSGTMVARIESWATPILARGRLLMHRGWSSTARDLPLKDIIGSAVTCANARQRAALRRQRGIPATARDRVLERNP